MTATVAALLLAAGCSGSQEAGSQETESASSTMPVVTRPASSSQIDAAVVRGRSAYDFAQTKSVTEASQKASSVLAGEVVGWSDGRSTVESDGAGYEDIARTAVLTVKVTKSYANSTERAGDLVYVEVPRGGEILVNGEPPEGTTPVLATIPELTSAVPAGTPVILLANPARSSARLAEDTPGLVVRGEGEGLPAGATLLGPTIQGLLFRDGNGAFSSGLADGEGDWGWLPASKARTDGYEFLIAELDQIG
ncbi:hypothetical protein [Nocardioides hungaricus]